MLAAVAKLDPEMAEKMPQEVTAAKAMPPRQAPKSVFAPLNNSLDMRALEANTPIKINIGIGLKL